MVGDCFACCFCRWSASWGRRPFSAWTVCATTAPQPNHNNAKHTVENCRIRILQAELGEGTCLFLCTRAVESRHSLTERKIPPFDRARFVILSEGSVTPVPGRAQSFSLLLPAIQLVQHAL